MASDGKRAAEAAEDVTEPKKAKTAEGFLLNANLALDKEHEGKSFKEIIKLPPGALQGLAEGKADKMLSALKVKTIEDLANWKHYRIAKAINTLAALEEDGKRSKDSLMNINLGLDVKHENASFKEMLELPPSALQGLADWTDTTLKGLKISSIKDLADFKYAAWAQALVTAAEFEADDFRSA